MRYCNFILHAYSQMYDGPVHGHAPDTHAHRTTRTRLSCEDATRTCNAATLQKRIQPSYAACDSAPGALFAPPQLQTQPTCERRAGGGHAVPDAAESLSQGHARAVSTCAYKLMGSCGARGSAYLSINSSSGRRHLRGGDVQRGQRSPLCSSACRRLCAVQCNLSRARARAPTRNARACPASSGSPSSAPARSLNAPVRRRRQLRSLPQM